MASQPPAKDQAPTTGSVSRDALLYLPGRVVPSVVQVLTVTVLTVYFTSAEIGRYELGVRFVVFLATLTALWLSMGILRLHAAYAKDGREAPFLRVINRIQFISIALGLVAGTLVYFFGPDALFGSYRDLLPAGLFAFMSYGAFEVGLSVLRARRHPLSYSLATSLNALLRLPLAVLLFSVFGMGISGMLWALGITYFVAYVLVVWPRTRPAAEQATRPGEAAAIRTEVMAYCWPILGTQLLNFFVTNLDRYLLKILQGDVDVGLYAIGTALVDQPMVLVLQTFALAVIPGVAIAWETQGREATEKLMAGLTRVFVLLSAPLLALLATGAPHAFGVLARGESAAAASVAPWLATAAFFYGMTYLANLGLHLSKRTGLLLALTMVAMGINIAGNYLLIPHYGFVGAGMARVLSNGSMMLLFALAGARYLRWRIPLLSMARIAASGVAAALTVSALSSVLPVSLPGLVLLFSAGLAVYGAGIVLSGEVPPKDLLRYANGLRNRLKRG
jgi:O-antigen/teichoic acid export membrane protein